VDMKTRKQQLLSLISENVILETMPLYSLASGQLSVTVNKDQLKPVLNKLEEAKIELLRLRAMLLPEDELREREKRKLEEARKEMVEGRDVNLEDLVKEMG